MAKPTMFYFGPWDRAGHYLHDESGNTVWDRRKVGLPWGDEADGGIQPHFEGCRLSKYSRFCACGSGPEGVALLLHKDGWTALTFWDRSVDKRSACSSTYFAEGTFTFDEMVELAKDRFAFRWNKMKFPVTEVTP
jgi:hypothetical protein